MAMFTALAVAVLALAPMIESASVSLIPDTAGAANVEWDVVLWISTCGRPTPGRSVSLRFLPPLVVPERMPRGAAQFEGEPVDLRITGDTVEVQLDPERMPQYCLHDRPIRTHLVLLPAAGLQNPSEPGNYAVEISTPDNPVAFSVSVDVREADEPAGGDPPAD